MNAPKHVHPQFVLPPVLVTMTCVGVTPRQSHLRSSPASTVTLLVCFCPRRHYWVWLCLCCARMHSFFSGLGCFPVRAYSLTWKSAHAQGATSPLIRHSTFHSSSKFLFIASSFIKSLGHPDERVGNFACPRLVRRPSLCVTCRGLLPDGPRVSTRLSRLPESKATDFWLFMCVNRFRQLQMQTR